MYSGQKNEVHARGACGGATGGLARCAAGQPASASPLSAPNTQSCHLRAHTRPRLNLATYSSAPFRLLSSLQDAVIVAAKRTPIGSLGGALASVTAPQLGSTAIKAAMEQAGLSPEHVDEAFLGNVVSAGVGQAPARQAVLGAGLPKSVPCTTVNKVCASGMKTLMFAAQSVATGAAGTVIAGGFESMSNAPFYLPGARWGMKYGHGKVEDALLKDGLWDVYNDMHMGNCGELAADEFGYTRADQDEYAVRSYKRAQAAIEAGKFANEITAVTVKSRKGELVVDTDEEPFKVNFDKLPTLRASFKKDGTVTAANASPLNDGAAALIVMSAERAAELGVTPLARIRGFGDAATEPELFTKAPALAVPKALAAAGVSATDIDYHEINEAFSVVAMLNSKLMNLDLDKVNANGGAVALGHPIGCSGARIVGTLINVLQQNDATLGCASICNGGGGASAIVIERL